MVKTYSVGGYKVRSDWKIYLIKMKKSSHIQDGLWVGMPGQAAIIKRSQTPHYYGFNKEDIASIKIITPAKARKLLKSEDAGWVG